MNEKKKSREKLQAKLKDDFKDISKKVKKGKKLTTAQTNQKILSELAKRKNGTDSKKEVAEEIKKIRKSKNKYRVITRKIDDPNLGKIEQKIECDFDIDLTTV